jgi:hypothetical protein
MKTKKDVIAKVVKNIEKKSVKKKGIAVKSRVKAGGFWEDMRALYGIKSS